MSIKKKHKVFISVLAVIIICITISIIRDRIMLMTATTQCNYLANFIGKELIVRETEGISKEDLKIIAGQLLCSKKSLIKRNCNDQLIDVWGSEFLFSFTDGANLEVNSSGPDKIIGTRDDIIAKLNIKRAKGVKSGQTTTANK